MQMPMIGDVVNDRYRLEAVLGEGGFGTVYRALDLQTRIEVAVKVLQPDDGEQYLASTQRRFEREVAILQQLTSPNTVQLLAFGTSGRGRLYLVFELLPGRDLAEVLAHGPLDAPTVEHILRQTLASLNEAHRLGLLHRDIKPANIRVLQVVGDPFFVKVLDFGIARSQERDRVAVTKTGELIGTPRYMSPEQLREGELTAASDIYSLGVVAVEMLIGTSVMGPNSLRAQLDRLAREHLLPAPIAAAGPVLGGAIHKMTATAVAQRYRTAAQVLNALDNPPASQPADTRRPRSAAAVVAVVALAAAVAGLFALWASGGTQEQAPVPTHDPTRIESLVASHDSPPVDEARVVDAGAAEPDLDPPDLPVRACNTLEFRGAGTLDYVHGPLAVYVPTNLDFYETVPIVVVLHGRYDQPEAPHDWLDRSGWMSLADREGFAIVAPRDDAAFLEPWEEPSDVEKVRRAVARITDDACVDASRVFVVTQSDAAALLPHLRCLDWVTAFGRNSSRMVHEHTNDCATRPTIVIEPVDTDRLPREGGSRCRSSNPLRKQKWRGKAMSLEQHRQEMLALHRCRDSKGVREDAEGVSCWAFDCDIPVRLCEHGGGEPWPGTRTTDRCAGEAADFPAAEMMWSFFQQVEPLKPK